jgi:hypothetical protein
LRGSLRAAQTVHRLVAPFSVIPEAIDMTELFLPATP